MKKIVVIEDDKMICKLYKYILRDPSWEIIFAYDGEEGFQTVSSIVPDVVILDLTIPKLHGLEVLKKVKNDPLLSKIPVIVASGNPDLKNDCKQIGCDQFFTKPFDSKELKKEIMNFLK